MYRITSTQPTDTLSVNPTVRSIDTLQFGRDVLIMVKAKVGTSGGGEFVAAVVDYE